MGIFRNFPYTNFHDLNLDTILKIVKDVSQGFNDLKEDYDNFKIDTVKYISDFVKEWFKDHPEAVNPENYDNDLVGNTYTPIYMGDFVESNNIIPSSFALVNNILYILCWKTVSNNGEGKVIRVNLETNKILDSFETYLCHCNSCATVINRNAHYIAKSELSDSNGDIIRVNGIIKYDTEFTEYTEIGMSQPWLGVSYDEITNKLYAYEIDGSLYEIDENDDFNFIGKIQVGDDPEEIKNYNQDIAIHNDVILLSSYTGDVLKTNVNALDVLEYGFIDKIDGTYRYIFDEPEGWEFVNGELWCVQFSKHRTVQSYGFLTRIVSKATRAMTPIDMSNVAGSHFTAEIKEANMDNFAMFEHEFKHPNQINTSLIKYNTIYIDNDTNFGRVYLTEPYVINHSLVCDTLQIRATKINFDMSYDGTVDIGTIDTTYRGCDISFAGDYGKEYTVGNINSGTSNTHVNIRKNVKVNYDFGSLQLVTPYSSNLIVTDNTDVSVMPKNHIFTNNVSVPSMGSANRRVTITLPFVSKRWKALFSTATPYIVGATSMSVDATTHVATIDINMFNFKDEAQTPSSFSITMIHCDSENS